MERRYLPSGRINIENKSEILSVRATAVQWSPAAARHLPHISEGTALNFSVDLNRIPKAVVRPGTRLFLV